MLVEFIRQDILNKITLPEQVWVIDVCEEKGVHEVLRVLCNDNRRLSEKNVKEIITTLFSNTQKAIEHVRKMTKRSDEDIASSKEEDSMGDNWDNLLCTIGIENWDKINLPAAIVYCYYLSQQEVRKSVINLTNTHACVVDHAVMTAGDGKRKPNSVQSQFETLTGKKFQNSKLMTFDEKIQQFYAKRVSERINKEKQNDTGGSSGKKV